MLSSYHTQWPIIAVRRVWTRRLSLAYQLHQPSIAEVLNPPLIILHGLFGSKQNNRSITLARDLSAPVYAVDLRNHGDSPHSRLHSYDTMADDVEQFVHDHNLANVALIGHSMGAKVAMTVALRSPSLLRALIPVDNAPVDANLKSDFHKYVRGLREIEEKRPQKQVEADAILQDYERNLAIRQFLLTNLIRSKDGGGLQLRIPIKTLAARLDNMGDFPYKDPSETRFDGSTLVIRGSKSHYVPDDVLPVMGQFFPRFILKDIDSGHWVISEQPEAFRQAVVEFMLHIDSRNS